MREILKKIQVHVPFYLLRENLLPMVIREGINPEISFNHRDLDRFQTVDFRETADRLADAGLSVTFHAPFLDLRPGAIDPRIRQVTAGPPPPGLRPDSPGSGRVPSSATPPSTKNTISPARSSGSKTVSTPGGPCSGTSGGRRRSSPWRTSTNGTPSSCGRLLDALDSPQVRFCFDTGHANAFGGAPLGAMDRDARRSSGRDPHPRQRRHDR